MPTKFRGVMQSPVTPLKDDFSLDLPTFERLLDFHVRTGATAISWPHHKGESLNLTIAERKAFAEVAVKVVAGRIPVSIHVSALAVEDSMELARHAQETGADAIIAITPYFWNPSIEGIYDYFVRLGTSIDLPLIAYNSPSYLSGLEFTGELTRRLIEPETGETAMARVYARNLLTPGTTVAGPAAIIEDGTTTIVPTGRTARIGADSEIVIEGNPA